MFMYRANDAGIKCDDSDEGNDDCEEKTDPEKADKENKSPNRQDLLKPTHFLKICNLLQLAGANQTTGSHTSNWHATQQSINCELWQHRAQLIRGMRKTFDPRNTNDVQPGAENVSSEEQGGQQES